jgi:hypothetical protein
VSRPTNNHNNFLVFSLIKNAKILEQTTPLDMGRGGKPTIINLLILEGYISGLIDVGGIDIASY